MDNRPGVERAAVGFQKNKLEGSNKNDKSGKKSSITAICQKKLSTF